MSPAQQHAFDTFWRAYPRKVGKLAAAREWERYHPDLDTVLMALDWQRLAWTDPHYIPHPRTYLHQGRWMDEPDEPLQREHWTDECRRLHGTQEDGRQKCHSLTWHEAQKAKLGQREAV